MNKTNAQDLIDTLRAAGHTVALVEDEMDDELNPQDMIDALRDAGYAVVAILPPVDVHPQWVENAMSIAGRECIREYRYVRGEEDEDAR